MTEVDSAPRGHPGPLQDDADAELDWMLRDTEESSPRVETASPDSVPPRSHTPGGGSSAKKQPSSSASYAMSASPVAQPLHPGTDDVENISRVPARPASQADDSGDEGEYDSEMTADQKMAMKELHEMKLDLAYAEEEPPEYDVAERVRQLNEELAKVPSPTEHHRAIKFNANPVSLIVPPPEYPSDDEEAKTAKQDQTEGQTPQGQAQGPPSESKTQGQPPQGQLKKQVEVVDMERDDSDLESVHSVDREVESVEKDNVKVIDLADDDDVIDEEVPNSQHRPEVRRVSDSEDEVDGKGESRQSMDRHGDDTNTDSPPTDSKTTDGEKVLVERNGKFELVEVNTLSAEEKKLYCPEYIQSDSNSVSSKSSSNDRQSRSESKARPARPGTATAAQTRARTSQRRVQSAQPRQTDYTTYEDCGYKSPYALSENEKQQLKREQRRKEDGKKKKDDDEKRRKEKDDEEAEDCFQSWLKQKRREASLRRREDSPRRKNNGDHDPKDDTDSVSEADSHKESEDAFSNWLSVKKQESHKSRSVERAIRREQQEQYNLRPRTECDKAFTTWLKKKNSEVRKAKSDETNRNRVVRLLQRRSRKSQQLAQAMTHAQAFKYVDYYGYRY